MKKLLAFLLGTAICLSCCGCSNQSLSIGDFPEQMNMYEEYRMEIKSSGIDEADILWTSSDNRVVNVKDGVITAVGMGTAIVSATYGEYKHSGEILVMRNKVAHMLTADKNSLTMSVGDEEKVVVGLKESGSFIENPNIVWESSNPNVVAVDQEGNVKALKRGTAVVSAYVCYKGHELVKNIQVRSMILDNKETTLALQESTSGASLSELGSEKTQYGFSATKTAYHYVTDGGIDSRIFSNEAYVKSNVSNYDRLLFKVRFTESLASGTMVYLANYLKGVKCDGNLISRDNCFLFYDENNNIAKGFDVNKTYTVVIDLNKTGNGLIKGGKVVYEYGFAFIDATEAYVGEAMLCSEDYVSYVLGFEDPEPVPNFTCMYAETYKDLELGEETMEEFNKYWICYSTGTPNNWDESMWNNRVTVGGVSYLKYMKYDYIRMDIMFTAVNMRSIYFWTGEMGFDYSPSGSISRSSVVPGYDFTVFLGEADVTGQPLLAGKVYTFRIRITGKSLGYETTAFGFNVNSATKNVVYVANPMLTYY